jgi:hypothetical protein
MESITKDYETKVAQLNFEIAELKARIIELEGWKGKDKIIIFKSMDYWVVKTHRKDKDSGEIKTETHRVTSESVDILYRTIISLSNGTDKVLEAMEIWEELTNVYSVKMDLNAFNGGKNRAPYYFPFYYYPMKILEHQKLVHYSGGGKTKLLDPHRKPSKPKVNLVSSLFD